MSSRFWRRFWILLCVGLVGFAGPFFGFHYLSHSGFFIVQQVVYLGFPESPKDIVDNSSFFAAQIKEFQNLAEQKVGQDLWRIDLKSYKEGLAKNQNWLQNLEVVRHWPNQIDIYYQVKSIVAVLKTEKQGKSIPLTEKGELVPTSTKDWPKRPVIKGLVFEKDEKMRVQALELLRQMPTTGGTISRQNIDEVHFEESSGYWVKLIDQDTQVRIGKDNFMVKAMRVRQVLDYMNANEIEARVIDANFSKKVLVKRKR